MKFTYKSSKLTYKSLFTYSLIIIGLLVIAVPVLANNRPGNGLLDFSYAANDGHTIQSARPLSKGINVNHLNPGEETWYVYSRDTFNDPAFSWISLALRFESEALISPDQANFAIVTHEQTGSLYQPKVVTDQVLGAGTPSPVQTSTPGVIETFWTGHVAEYEEYYVHVFNNSPFKLEYALEAKVENPAVSGAIPASTNAAVGNPSTLNARQTAWTLTAQAVENMTAGQAADWMQQAQAVGWLVTAGTSPDTIANPGEANPQTLWRLTAQAIDGLDADRAAQWLIQADAMGWLNIPPSTPPSTLKNPIEDVVEYKPGGGDEGGGGEPEEEPARPIQPDDVYTPVNIYPNNPLNFNFEAVNSGRLAPYGEHWYEVLRDDLDEDWIEDLALTMFFTPSQGFISNRVNFEIFPASQYHIWLRGDADYMENIGLGMWVSRDKDPNTSERLWAGALVDGDRYLIKVKNGTPDEVDYYLFPNDVNNAELGNPTLHQAESLAGRVPYAVSPPTRIGPPPEPGSGPPEAMPLKIGTTKGKLEAGEEMWYKFEYSDSQDDDSPEHDFIFYLTNTPADDIRARHADFEIFPGGQLHLWVRGTIDELDPVGASAPATFTKLKDERSLQVLWAGQLMEEHVYYVKVYNHDIGPLDYEFEIKGGP